MASIRSKDTRPEITVRSSLHRMGFRFRIHSQSMPGKPDVVLPQYRIVLWVHGCFWHGHKHCRAGKRPVTNVEYWHTKLIGNMRRDTTNMKKINRLGWRNFVIWECEAKDHETLALRLRQFKAKAQKI